MTKLKIGDAPLPLTLYVLAYSDIYLTIAFHAASLQRLQMDGLKAELAKSPALVSIFNAAAKLVGERLIPAVEHQGLIATFGGRLALEDFRLCGESVIDVQIEGKARLVCARSPRTYCQRIYGCSELNLKRSGKRSGKLIILRYPLGETSIVHAWPSNLDVHRHLARQDAIFAASFDISAC